MTNFRTLTLSTAAAILALGVSFSQASAATEAPIAPVLTQPAAPQTQIASLLPPTDLAKAIQAERPVVAMPGNYAAGDIVVVNAERKLYLSLGDGKALVYPVAIGKPGRQLTGTVRVTQKVKNPSWRPTPNIKAENPGLPDYVAPGPNNPLGPRALYLSKGFYRIHGTNKPSSIGRAASNGCIRMLNKDVVDLFGRVTVGATVTVIN